MTSQCKELIETYGEAIIELLVQQADPKTVCTVLALCNEASRAYVGKFMRVLNFYIQILSHLIQTYLYIQTCKFHVQLYI